MNDLKRQKLEMIGAAAAEYFVCNNCSQLPPERQEKVKEIIADVAISAVVAWEELTRPTVLCPRCCQDRFNPDVCQN